MKFTTTNQEFLAYYAIAASISESKSLLDINYGVKVCANEKEATVTLLTPPSYISFETTILSVETVEEGTACFQAKTVSKFLQKIKKQGDIFNVQTSENNVKFVSENSTIKSTFCLHQDFITSDCSLPNGVNFFEIEIDDLVESIQKTSPFLDRSGYNPIFDCLYIDLQDCFDSENDSDYSTVRFFVVNNHSTTFVKKSVVGYEVDKEKIYKGFCVPSELIEYWIQIVKTARQFGEEKCKIGYDGNNAYLSVGNSFIKGTTIDSPYPPVRKLFARNDLPSVIIQANELQSAIEIASTATDVFNIGIYLHFFDEKLEVVGKKSEICSASITIETGFKGEDILCRVNPKILSASLAHLDNDDKIQIELKEVSLPSNKEEEKYRREKMYQLYIEDANSHQTVIMGMTV